MATRTITIGVPDFTLDADGTLAANSDTKVATQKATKTYVDTHAPQGGGESEWESGDDGIKFDDPPRAVGMGAYPSPFEATLALKGNDPFSSPIYSVANDGAQSYFTLNSWTVNNGNFEKAAGDDDSLGFSWDGYEAFGYYNVYVTGYISAGSLQFKLRDSAVDLYTSSTGLLTDNSTIHPSGTTWFDVWFRVSPYDATELIEAAPSSDFAGFISDIRVCFPRRSALAVYSASGYLPVFEVDYQGNVSTDINLSKALQICQDNRYLNLDAQGLYINFNRGSEGDVVISGGDDSQMKWGGVDQVAFTPSEETDWSSVPTTVAEALDELARAVAAVPK